MPRGTSNRLFVVRKALIDRALEGADVDIVEKRQEAEEAPLQRGKGTRFFRAGEPEAEVLLQVFRARCQKPAERHFSCQIKGFGEFGVIGIDHLQEEPVRGGAVVSARRDAGKQFLRRLIFETERDALHPFEGSGERLGGGRAGGGRDGQALEIVHLSGKR